MPIENVIKLSLKYLSAPNKLWESGRLDLQRLVLKLTFSGHLRYRKGEGIKLPELTLPFNYFKHLGGNMSALTPAFAGKCEMVHLSRESSNYLFEVLSEWNQVLETIDDPVNDLEIDVHREVG